MKAIQVTGNHTVEITDIPQPTKASKEHVVVKMLAFGINPGDHAFINGVFPKGTIPESKYNLSGVSGVGTIVETGEGVPAEYQGRNVTIYRSLQFDDDTIGTWSEYSHLHYLQCAIIPDGLDPEEYAASLVNIITPYGFFKQAREEGHQGLIATAGTSATGLALLGICQASDFPIISIVRNEAGRKELEALGATHILVQDQPDFKQLFQQKAQDLQATAVFDGVGGAVLNNIIDLLPFGSTIFAYGWLGGGIPLTFHTSLLMKGLTIRGFNNYRTTTVQDPEKLEEALRDISRLLVKPHFKTRMGEKFRFEAIHEALQHSEGAGKTIVRV
ncbi:zinc-binding dehydrogenase [Fluviicola sp.]|uniref:zinc-binding dehydrogenase n=1 Tax=Fluviicola sp. TaxID=1917219 RepID=UPI0031DAF32F